MAFSPPSSENEPLWLYNRTTNFRVAVDARGSEVGTGENPLDVVTITGGRDHGRLHAILPRLHSPRNLAMHTIQLDIPDELAKRLAPYSDHLLALLELGLQVRIAQEQQEYSALREGCLQILAAGP
jgi:hypothetical protein